VEDFDPATGGGFSSGHPGYGKERDMAKTFAFPLTKKLSMGFDLLFSNIRDTIYSFGKESFFTMCGYVRLASERL
jgi:hypothetical protein